MPSVIVVGAGFGGLSCALDLAARGFAVTVLEKEAWLGGKARQVTLDGRLVDAGPTSLTMRWVFDELFERAGASFSDEVTLDRAELLSRHVWHDGRRLDLYADRERAAEEIGDELGARAAREYLSFWHDARRIYEIAEGPFLRAQRMSALDIAKRFGAAGLGALARLDSHRSMHTALSKRFTEPKLAQLFGRNAAFLGSSPFEAPATMNLIAHVQGQGTLLPRGGMSSVVGALARVAKRLGVTVRTETPVLRVLVDRGRARGVETTEGAMAADAVVFNGDVSALGQGSLSRPAAAAAKITAVADRSLSAVTWAMVARAQGFPLAAHTVVYCEDARREHRDLLKARIPPTEPTVHVCALDRAEGEQPREERLLAMINAPPTGDDPSAWSDGERMRCTEAMERALRRVGLRLVTKAYEQTTPVDFHRWFPGSGGALYGPRSRGSTSVLARAGSATKVARLYLAGGSVHPGPGVSMAALSGVHAAARVSADLASIGPSPTAATSGTTWTG